MTRIKFVDAPPFQDTAKIEARLMATLRRLRDTPRQPARAAWEDEDDSEPKVTGKTITYDDTKKVKRRASLLADRQAAYAGVSHLKKDELARITPALQRVDLVMVKTEHWADEAAADLHADMPWMGPATEYAWHALRRAARRSEAIRMRPVILNGPPGIGKSVWARKLAKLLSVPTADIDASKGGAGFALCGLDRGWSSALAGRPLDLILSKLVANPVIIVDEICKAKRATSTSGTGFSFANALLSLIEPATSAEWECPYFRLRFDMSHILWVMTANDVHKVPEPVCSRCQLIQLPDITPAQLNAFAKTQVSTKWYVSLFSNQKVIDALLLSLKIALVSATVATILGTMAGILLARFRRSRGRTLFSGLVTAPLIMPEVITGSSLLIFFILLGNWIGWRDSRGFTAIMLAHITFSAVFVTTIVQARMVQSDRANEEAAMDLGDKPLQVMFDITLPVISPAILSGWLLAFTISLDDVVITAFTTGPGATTLPLLIWSKVNLGVTPDINALATLMVVTVGVGVVLSGVILNRAEKRRQEEERLAFRAND